MSVKFIDGVARLAHAYDGFILDLWGVLYDGGVVFDHALDVLARLKAMDKRLVILSNGPRRAAAVEERIAKAEIPRDLYDSVMSSGEEAWLCLNGEIDDPWYRDIGRRVFYIGPDSDRAMLDGLGLTESDSAAEADFIFNIGPFAPTDMISDYEDMLAAAAARHVPMVCANPDLVVHRLGTVEICAGSTAERYEELGGRVRWHGKPHPSIASWRSAIPFAPTSGAPMPPASIRCSSSRASTARTCWTAMASPTRHGWKTRLRGPAPCLPMRYGVSIGRVYEIHPGSWRDCRRL
jgi:HAD superfamily hydrolase (TIGR01459 family)